MRELTGRLCEACRIGMIACFGVLLLLTMLQVINRATLNAPIYWTDEGIILMLVWATCLGLPHQLWNNREIVVDIVPLPGHVANTIKRMASLAICLATCGVLVWYGAEFAWKGWRALSPSMQIPRFWFFLPIPLAALLSVPVLIFRPEADGPAEEII